MGAGQCLVIMLFCMPDTETTTTTKNLVRFAGSKPKLYFVEPKRPPDSVSNSKQRDNCLLSPIPQINWRRSDGLPLPSKIKLRKFSAVLEIPDFQQEDAGSYECVAENSRGRNMARGRLTYYGEPGSVRRAGGQAGGRPAHRLPFLEMVLLCSGRGHSRSCAHVLHSAFCPRRINIPHKRS